MRGQADIIVIFEVWCKPSFQVAVGMIAGSMPAGQYLSVNIRVSFHISSNAEKCSLDIELCQYRKHFGRDLRGRPVIKGEIKGWFCIVNIPGDFRIYFFENPGCSYQVHQSIICQYSVNWRNPVFSVPPLLPVPAGYR